MLQYIEETEEFAMKKLMENRHILDIVAKELLEHSRITGLVSHYLRFILLICGFETYNKYYPYWLIFRSFCLSHLCYSDE